MTRGRARSSLVLDDVIDLRDLAVVESFCGDGFEVLLRSLVDMLSSMVDPVQESVTFVGVGPGPGLPISPPEMTGKLRMSLMLSSKRPCEERLRQA
jgi:hypothetical protein